MAKKTIKDDVRGVVTVHVGSVTHNLRAGDDVPQGANVADHLVKGETTNDKPGARRSSRKTTDDAAGE